MVVQLVKKHDEELALAILHKLNYQLALSPQKPEQPEFQELLHTEDTDFLLTDPKVLPCSFSRLFDEEPYWVSSYPSEDYMAPFSPLDDGYL